MKNRILITTLIISICIILVFVGRKNSEKSEENKQSHTFCNADEDCTYYLGPEACGCFNRDADFSAQRKLGIERYCSDQPENSICECKNNKCILSTK